MALRPTENVFRRDGDWLVQDGGDPATRPVAEPGAGGGIRGPGLGRLVQHPAVTGAVGYMPPAEYEARYYEQAAVA